MRTYFTFILLPLLVACSADQTSNKLSKETEQFATPLKTEDIRIRDPFIITDVETQTYYMYAQLRNRLAAKADEAEANARHGVEVYRSKDLQNWSNPQTVLELPLDFWARRSVWAPEVHAYKGAYYLFVTLTSSETISDGPNPLNGETLFKRGTHIFKSASPTGPFLPLREKGHTPEDWMSLDGTLYVEKEPYMVFCHEWAQTLDGTMAVVKLTEDLSATIGMPITLFSASEAPWVKNMQEAGIKRNGFVTDGPAFFRNKNGDLIMLWSSFGEQQYAIGQAISRSASIFGPWEQKPEPLVKANGGHGMLFQDLNGQLLLAYHQPNSRGKERLKLDKIKENEEGWLERY